MTVHPRPFPELLQAWVVRPLRGGSTERCLVLCADRAADRVSRRLQRVLDVQIECTLAYQRLPPGGEWGDLYLDSRAGDHGSRLMLAISPGSVPRVLNSMLDRHGPLQCPYPTRVAYVLHWPTRGAIVRVERTLDRRQPDGRHEPPLWLLNTAQAVQRALATDNPLPRSHEVSLRSVANDLLRYYHSHGHCHVRQRDPDWPALGKALDKLRASARRAGCFAQRFEQLCRELHPELTLWDTHTPLDHVRDPHEAAALTAKSGVFHERWLVMYEQLKAFRAEHGHCSVKTKGWPPDHPLAPLGRWANQQRVRAGDGSMLRSQHQLLHDLGFDFAPRRLHRRRPAISFPTEDRAAFRATNC